MRPIDKGICPYKTIKHYQDAEQYLEKKIGRYCSFCEMRIDNSPAVEHKESKNSGGALTEWNNLLLSCVYCNSRKSEKIKKGELYKWIWPDQDNTFLAFTYEGALPQLNEKFLKAISDRAYEKSKKIFDDLALDYFPENKKGEVKKLKCKDRRWQIRLEALQVAEEAKKIWKMCETESEKENQKWNILNMAKGYGFFSVWMMIFEDDAEIKNALIDVFPGTSKECFDQNGSPIRREKGII